MLNSVTLLIMGILLAGLAGLAWFAVTSTGTYQRKAKSASLEKLRSSNRYRGITIRNGKCPAVRRLGVTFYTFENVPVLPLAGCTALRCSCIYAGLNNRRYQERREGFDLRSAVRFDPGHTERRDQNDRRKSNRIKWRDPVD